MLLAPELGSKLPQELVVAAASAHLVAPSFSG